MKSVIRTALLAAVATLLALPVAASAAGPPSQPGSGGNGKGKQTTTTTTTTSGATSDSSLPDPGAALPNGKAYGVYCKNQPKTQVAGQTGTQFSRCVTAMAKAATGGTTSAKSACAALAKTHDAGQKGTPYSRCVAGAAKLLASRHAHGVRLDRKSILPSACNGKGAKLLVNVTFTLENDADSGFAGNEWANDTIHRTLRIWQEQDGSFCTVVGDTGSFVTVAGTSPNKSGTVPDGITGRVQGGYVATFAGTLNSSPTYAARGNLGTFDLMCDASFSCPGAHPSFASYVDLPSPSAYELPAWGWIYRTAKNGTWVNQSSGSNGDITG